MIYVKYMPPVLPAELAPLLRQKNDTSQSRNTELSHSCSP
jgi:hypothetical protein